MAPSHANADTDNLDVEPGSGPLTEAGVEVPSIESELLIEEISIDGMCGVY